MKKIPRSLVLLGVLMGLGFCVIFLIKKGDSIQDLSAPQPESKETENVKVAADYGKLPLHFEPNVGQTDAQVDFVSRGQGYSLFLKDGEAVLALSRPNDEESEDTQSDVVRIQLLNAKTSAKVSGVDPLSGKSNYLLGNDQSQWHTNVPHYGKVKYEEVYPGIDLVYYGTEQRLLEHDFVVSPGADPNVIRFSVEGAKRLVLDLSGNLVASTAGGDVVLKAPVTYQEIDGERIAIESRYQFVGDSVGFELAAYDPAYDVVIDPVLSYSTYLGGNSSDQGNDIVVDTSGNAYVIGTTSTVTAFPVQSGFQTTSNGLRDIFISVVNSTGSGLLYSTYLGGSDQDYGNGIVIDGAGNIFVTGYTESTDFPVQSAIQTSLGGGEDVFVLSLNNSGSALIYSTYLGGNGDDQGHDIAIDGSGNAFVTGMTKSTNFPLQSAVQATFGGINDVFVSALNSSGSALIYSTYLGGNGNDWGYSIAVDGSGNAFVTGETASPNFPLQSAYQATIGGFHDAFVSGLNSLGSALIYSTYLGGSGNDRGYGIVLDGSGNAHVAGFTQSFNFPIQSAFQSVHGSGGARPNAFVTKLNGSGSGLIYSTYLGGIGSEHAYGIDLDSSGNAYIAGRTSSVDFPVLSEFQTTYAGGLSDVIVSVFTTSGSGLIYSTYLGTSNDEIAFGIAVDNSGNAYVTGLANSANFPVFSAFQATNNGGGDAFVTKIIQANDFVSPTVTSITRLDNNPTNLGSVRFQIAFSEPVIGIDSGDFQINTGGTLSASFGGVTGVDSLYNLTITINSGDGSLDVDLLDDDSIVDAGGNPLGGSGAQNFTLGESYNIDNTAPLINSTTPVDDTTNVLVNTNLSVLFSENVQKGTGNITVKRSSDHFSVNVVDVLSSNVSVTNNIVTVTLGVALNEGTEYYVLIDDTVFDDVSGNDFVGISDHFGWNFITEVLTIPVSIPDTLVKYGTTIDVPIQMNTNVTGEGVVASEISVTYRKDIVLSAVTSLTRTAGTATTNSMVYQGWSIEENVFAGASVDTLKIAMSTAQDTLTGQGDLIYLTLQVADIRHPDSTPLELVSVLFNDGTPGANATDGSLTITGTDGSIVASPDSINPADVVTVTITDADFDVDVGTAEQVTASAVSKVYGDTETVTLTETGVNTGVFIGTLNTSFSLVADPSQNGTLGTIAGDSICVSYLDSLDSVGASVTRVDTVEVIGGTDGTAAISYVVQALDGRNGLRDTVRVQVSDADLDTDVGVAEQVSATVTNTISGEIETLTLTETGVNTGVFQVRVPTIAGASGTNNNGEFSLASWDTLSLSYNDALSAQGGLNVVQDIGRVVNLFGDVRVNDQVQAFDAARLLAISVGLISSNTQTTLVGDVDGNSSIQAFDASRVLQYVVRLIDRFGVQTDFVADPKNHPFEKPVPLGDVIALGELKAQGDGTFLLPVSLGEREGILSGTLTLGVDAGIEIVDVDLANDYGSFMVAHNMTTEGLKVAFAGSQSELRGSGDVLMLKVRGVEGSPILLSLDHVVLNGQTLTPSVNIEAMEEVITQAPELITELHQNIPNPFNPQTTIKYAIAEAGQVEMVIYSVTGQRIRTLISEFQDSGSYQIVWDGKDAVGRDVSSGVYLMRMQATGFTQTKKMLLLR